VRRTDRDQLAAATPDVDDREVGPDPPAGGDPDEREETLLVACY
jgi:hypothetical protein